MGNYKISSPSQNEMFLVTESYKKLLNAFKNIKKSRGRIIHILAAPGTGKSANIYHALNELNLNVYDVEFKIKNLDTDSDRVFKQIYKYLKEDLDAGSKHEIYEIFGKYDAILFADKFHDSHLLDDNTIGFSVWAHNNGFEAFKFYFLCVAEYLKNRKSFAEINIILQTSWRIRYSGKKHDLFTDLGVISKIMIGVMKIFFEVVEISYNQKETIEIVKKHIDADEEDIKKFIEEYGNKPRFICQALEDKE